eukprot:10671832-Karenia_brevis.AAC.1
MSPSALAAGDCFNCSCSSAATSSSSPAWGVLASTCPSSAPFKNVGEGCSLTEPTASSNTSPASFSLVGVCGPWSAEDE